jgi:hypothetical protein
MNSFQSSSSSVVSSSSSSATISTNSSNNKNIMQHELLIKNKNYFDNLIYSQNMFGTMTSNETKPKYYSDLKLKIESLIRSNDNRATFSETASSNNSKLSFIDNKINNASESTNSISNSPSFDENFITSLFNMFISFDFKGFLIFL